MGKFTAQVGKFNKDATATSGEIFQRGIFKLFKEVKKNRKTEGGLTPSDTANMIRSIEASNTSMPKVDTEEKQYSEVSFSITPSDMGKPVYIGVQAVYGPRQNYGFVGTDTLGRNYNQAGAHFVEGAGAKWQQFISEAEAELK